MATTSQPMPDGAREMPPTPRVPTRGSRAETRSGAASGAIVALLVGLATICVAGRSVAFNGVQTNVPIASLTGWSLCYTDTYGNFSASLSTLLLTCNKAHLLLACRPVGSPILTVAAHAPRADVTFDTGTGNTPHNANGVGWYFSSSYSWGYAPAGDPIDRFSCDITASSLSPSGPDADKRLCWHTGNGFLQSGWRCGAADSLNSSNGYERLVFQTDTLACGNGTVDVGEQCDDGNIVTGDGCDATCVVEPCYACTGQPSTCSPLPDGSNCNDGLFCNGADSCSAGACTVHGTDPCAGGAECAEVCDEANDRCAAPVGTPCTDDGNVCTDDQCDGAGSCAHPANFFVPCDDGMFCNGSDACAGGSCVIHDGSPCALDECNSGCDEAGAVCVPTAAGVPCFGDGNPCTSDQCDGAGLCGHPPAASGTPCGDDGLVCTADQCNGFGACIHPARPSGVGCTADGNACTKDECNGAGACVHPAEPDGTACDDANACTQTDACAGGQCTGTNPVVCAVAPCRRATVCDPASGVCTSCPVGYASGGGGCQRTYVVDASELDNQDNFCDASAANRYGCSGPFGFHWQDTADDAVGDVTRVDIAFTSGVDCSGNVPHPVSLNGTPIGVYASTAASACLCEPPQQPRLLSDVDSAAYLKGSQNAVSIPAVACNGLSRRPDGHYALVTVTYADAGATYAIHADCRQAGRSKLKYSNATTDTKDKLLWRWGHGEATTPAELADPTASAAYQLCVYAEAAGVRTLLFGADVPASASRWSPLGSVGYRYKDGSATYDGITRMLLKRGGPTKAKIIVKGAGAALSDPPVPLAPIDDIRVQLTNEATGVCWESEFAVDSLTDRINISGP